MKRNWIIVAVAALLGGCSTAPTPSPVIGEAYAGPAELPLRSDLVARPKTVATLKHAERVEILAQRRRFLKVRTEKGVEGWLDSRQLLAESDLKKLRQLAERMAKAPSFGAVTVYEKANVHTVPNRFSPSFAQIQPNEQADVVAYHLAPKVPFTPTPLIEPPPKPAAAPKETRKKKQPAVPRPPAGKPPAVPENWLDLSRSAPPEEAAETPAAGKPAPPQPETPPPPTLEDWALVRIKKTGQCGWALTRLLVMAIPDEVAIYAERQRITAYYDVARVEDESGPKSYWLWTTLSKGGQKHHFDRIRLFTFNTRRHRYETAYQDREMVGYLPVEVQRTSGTSFTFRYVAVTAEGQAEWRQFSFSGYRVTRLGTTPAELPKPSFEPAESDDEEKLPDGTSEEDDKSITERLKKFIQKSK